MNFESFILIGGRSSRMGREKFSLVLQGKTFLEISVETLKKFGNVSVSANGRGIPVAVNNLNIVEDIYQNRGALGGIHSSLISSESNWTIILACDYPFVSIELIELLTDLAETEREFDAFAPVQKDGQIQPLCAVYKTLNCSRILSEMLMDADEKYSVRDFLRRLRTRYVAFDEIALLPNSEYFFFNVNTPEDLLAADRILTDIK